MHPASLRQVLYHLLGGVVVECPPAALLNALARTRELRRLADLTSEHRDLSSALETMAQALEAENAESIAADYAALFLGRPRAKAPPWESVYLGPERLVWQEPAREVLRAYARAELGYAQMKEIPPDHIGRELLFMASLAQRSADSALDTAGADLETQRAFFRDHLGAWAPRFAADVLRHAATDFIRAWADALTMFLEADRYWLDAPEPEGEVVTTAVR